MNAPAIQTPLKPKNTLSQAAALFSKLSADRTPLNPSFRAVPACKPRFTQVLPHTTLQQAAIPLQLSNIFLCARQTPSLRGNTALGVNSVCACGAAVPAFKYRFAAQ